MKEHTDLYKRDYGRLHKARMAVIGFFFINGIILASWATRIPAIQGRLSISAGQLGLSLFGAAVGALIAMNIAGRISIFIGSKPVTIFAALCLCIMLPLLAIAPSLPVFMLVLVLYGASNGSMDVTMNMQGAEVEKGYGKPIFNSFHACYSAGSLFGAFIGGIVASRGVVPLLHFSVVAMIGGIGIITAACFLLPANQVKGREEEKKQKKKLVFMFPSRILIFMGILAFGALLSEGAMSNWSAVYLSGTVHSGAGLAAIGYAVFSTFMAIGRFTGDYLARRMGTGLLMFFAALLASLGLGMGLIFVWTPIVFVGFALIGIGLSVIFPLILSATSRITPQLVGASLATVTTFGYCGSLIGPPLIGFVADTLNLRIALGIVVLMCFLIALLTLIAKVLYKDAHSLWLVSMKSQRVAGN